MNILPPSPALWREPIPRRHTPQPARGRYGYRTYRPCLRWEFGFTCPFCLCHEGDFFPLGVEGLGVTQIEHFVPVSHDSTVVNVYENCFYICRYCNQARGRTPVASPAGAGRLLNPCNDPWVEHFILSGDVLVARQESPAAVYTEAVYDLSDPRKVAMRRFRRETIEECQALLNRGPSLLAGLLEKAAQTHQPELVDEARFLEDALRRAWRDLERFQAVPVDAPPTCACETPDSCTLPVWLVEQTLAVEPPFGHSTGA